MDHQPRFSLDQLCIYDHGCDHDFETHCFNGFHLLKCKNMYCAGRFKCPSSYCISFDHICNKVCDCPHCEDESICTKLLCPGMVLIEQMGSDLRCSENAAALKHIMNMRQVIHTDTLHVSDEFPVLIHYEGMMNFSKTVLTPAVVVYCQILHSKIDITDLSVFHQIISVRRLLLPHNNIQKLHDSMLASMTQLIVLDLSYNYLRYLPKVALCPLRKLQYLSLHHNLISNLESDVFMNNLKLQVLLLESNKLKPWSINLVVSLPSLIRVSSDIPRLCCVFQTATFCSPAFPLLMSCSDMIDSDVQRAPVWIIGLSASFLNLYCLLLLVYKRFVQLTVKHLGLPYSFLWT